nr:recombinase RecT [Nonomuraea pusilla]
MRPGVGALGHGWLLPMWNGREGRTDATMTIGYRGYVALGYRDPAVQAIAAHCVYTNDTFKDVLHGARGTVEHTMAEGDRGLPEKYYGARRLAAHHRRGHRRRRVREDIDPTVDPVTARCTRTGPTGQYVT